MSFDAIPEDKQQSFPCEECGNGNIVKNKEGDWECDTCPAIYEAKRPAAPSLPECPQWESDMNEWQQEWRPTEHDNRLHELATRYYVLCEAYDRTVCTGPMGLDGIMPANPREMVMINRNAYAARKLLEEEAQREGIGREELSRAIHKWHGSLPNG